MNSGEDTASPTVQDNNTTGVTAPSDMDLQAINQAIAESANEAVKEQQNSFDVNSISLDNTPTTDAELQAQMEKDPNMSLAGSPSTSTSTESTGNTSPSAVDVASQPATTAPVAGFVDGDLKDDPNAQAVPEEKPDYAAREADPVESFDENAPIPTDVSELSETDKKDGDANSDSDSGDDKGVSDKKKAKKSSQSISIDFNAILHNNIAVIIIVILIVAALSGLVLLAAFNG